MEGEEMEAQTIESLQQAAEVATATQAVASGGPAAITSVFTNLAGQIINPAEYIQSGRSCLLHTRSAHASYSSHNWDYTYLHFT